MTAQSMTGFGQARVNGDAVQIDIEVRSVNHRFLEVVCKLPASYSAFEVELQRMVRERLGRGRVDIYVGRTETAEPQYEVIFNRPLYEAYLAVLKEAAAAAQAENALPIALANVLSRREVLELRAREKNAADESALLLAGIEQALDALVEMRRNEGERLEAVLEGLICQLELQVEAVAKRAGDMPVQLRDRLLQRLEKLGPEASLDPARVAQEAALAADRCDITEELDRLRSHISQFRSVLREGQGGRKLEFLLQEIGRELNTSGSKSQDAAITAAVIEGKAAAEKLREQVQNIE